MLPDGLVADGGLRTSTAGLLLANAVPLVGVVAFGWDVFALLLIYWVESAVVGAAFVARILRAEGEDDPAELPEMSFNDRSVGSFVGEPNRRIARFFAGHYGIFWVFHGVFVVFFLGAFVGFDLATLRPVVPAALALAAYHAVSYRVNFVGHREYEHAGPVTLMIEPYRRVLVMHLTIILGAFAVAMVGSSVGALVVMVLLKTVLDLYGHWSEHDRARKREPSPVPTP